MKNLKFYVVGGIVSLTLGFAWGRYLQPPKVVTKEVEVIKEVEVVKRDVRTIIKEVIKKDGTKETVTTIEDRSKETSKKKQETEKSVIVSVKPQWKVQGLVGIDKSLLPKYGVGVERRIIGPVFAGVWATTKQEIGVSVSIEF